MLRTSLSLSGVVLSFGLFAAPASAAPIGMTGAGVTTDASAVEQVARRCYRHRGHWHCREVYGYRPGVDIRIGRGHRHDKLGRIRYVWCWDLGASAISIARTMRIGQEGM